MIRLVDRFLVSLIVLGVSVYSSVSLGDSLADFPDIERIREAGELRVAILAQDAEPLIMTGAEGELAGSEPDLARDLAKELGVAVTFIRRAKTYDGVVDIVARKEADIAVSYLTGGVQRGLKVNFSKPYIQQSGRLFFNRAGFAQLKKEYGVENLKAIDSIPAASTLTVGVMEGNVYKTILQRNFPNLQLRTYENLDQIMSDTRDGELFAGIHGSLQASYYMRSHPSIAVYVAMESHIKLPGDIRIAVRPDAPNLLRWINLYLDNYVGIMPHDEIVDRFLQER